MQNVKNNGNISISNKKEADGMKNNQKRIYTIATAHLDTSWLWKFEKTVSDFIPRTINDNIALFKKYPDYTFNFEGSYRYELMEEYFPEDFEQVKEYIAVNRWVPCGSCYENGDVNTPSPEALWRNILYGNSYFEEKFGKPSTDIFLPDCFGFGRALPTIAAHAGLNGFSTSKLTWGCGEDVPFDIGRWRGPDGSEIFAALKPGAYTTSFAAVRNFQKINAKLKDNQSRFGLPWTFVYHGTGDRGGAPGESSVRTVVREMKSNKKSNTAVLSASTQDFFADMAALPAEQKEMLPVFDGELLLTEHGVGSYTSRAVSKRWNRRSELLADAAERNAAAAFALGLADYPQQSLDTAWKSVIAHQFHDDITGTSFHDCYKRNWNDYVRAMNMLSSEYTAATAKLAAKLDTSFAKGTPVAVSNPVQSATSRQQVVTAEIANPDNAFYVQVFDAQGNEVLSQILQRKKDSMVLAFLADVPGNGISVYDVRFSDKPCAVEKNPIKVTTYSLENERYRVRLNHDADIVSVYDRILKRELLSGPVRITIQDNVNSKVWPAWEIKYKDITSPVRESASNPEIRLTGFGPARGEIEIIRKINKSTFKQTLSLDAGGNCLRVENETDWQHEASLCKIEFPLQPRNAFAEYDIGIGTAKRTTNTERLFEVPAQRWAGITDSENPFGVAIFSDSRCGWDKPDAQTLRLTCMHTPLSAYRWECSQHLLDFGLNRYAFGIYGFEDKESVQDQADCFCQPLHSFVLNKHEGSLGSRFSFANINTDAVRFSCIKKAHREDCIAVRLIENTGKNADNVTLSFCIPVLSATEADGCEKHKGSLPVTDGKLLLSFKPFEVKTILVQLQESEKTIPATTEYPVLPFNITAFTGNKERANSVLDDCFSIPKEITPDAIHHANKVFPIQKDDLSAVVCDGQAIDLPAHCEHVTLLACSFHRDREAVFKADDNEYNCTVCDCFEAVGAWDLLSLGETGYIKTQPLAFTATHIHAADEDIIGKQFYLFAVTIPVNGAATLTLPKDENILVFSAATDADQNICIPADAHFDRLAKREFTYLLSDTAVKKTQPNAIEGKLKDAYKREKVFYANLGFGAMAINRAQVYYSVKSVLNPEKKKTK